jgi:hypothetical protein
MIIFLSLATTKPLNTFPPWLKPNSKMLLIKLKMLLLACMSRWLLPLTKPYLKSILLRKGYKSCMKDWKREPKLTKKELKKLNN